LFTRIFFLLCDADEKMCLAAKETELRANFLLCIKPIAGVDGSAERRFHRAERGFLRDIRARER